MTTSASNDKDNDKSKGQGDGEDQAGTGSAAGNGDQSESRRVKRDEQLGLASEHSAGPGTYVEDGAIRALFDGELKHHEKELRVTRERRPIPRRRLRRGQSPSDVAGKKGSPTTTRAAGSHRHGTTKHGRLRGKPKKGMGDQGSWD